MSGRSSQARCCINIPPSHSSPRPQPGSTTVRSALDNRTPTRRSGRQLGHRTTASTGSRTGISARRLARPQQPVPMAIVADGSAVWLLSFVVGHIEPGARVITGAWRGHNGRQDLGYVHERRNQRAGQRLSSSPRMGTRGLRVIRSLPSSWLPRRSRIGQARRWRPNGSSGHPGGQTRTWGPAQPGVQAGDQQGNISALLAASGHCPRSCARNVPWAGALWHGCGTDAGILGADPS